MRGGSSSHTQAGFTYLAMLLAVAVIGIGLAATSEVWVQSRQREKEQELLFVGNQFRQAIGLYYRNSSDQLTPGVAYPKKLEDLLEDKRGVVTKRHLRRLYADPLTGKTDWGLIPIKAPDGDRIMGVYSKSQMTPIKTAGFRERDKTFEGANHFSDWKFFYEPQRATSGKPPSGSAAQAPAFQGIEQGPKVPPMGSP
jgi:type II secretory pathway pseudopilin PulG